MYFNRFTQGAKTAINLGKSYAKGLGHRVVGTEHLGVGLLREKDGKIVIYKIDENGQEKLYETTEIAIDYLTDEDKENIKNGIKVNGKEELNQLIEDFE